MYKSVFVILHYLKEQDTIECVESILENVDYENYYIVIVDNGSKNNSGQKLLEKYAGNQIITIIINNENLGFAKGNNVGYRYAKYELKSDFIILINNDTMIKQNNFINHIIKKFDFNPFHILGPDIISLIDGRHQNPSTPTLQSIENLKCYIKNHRISLFLNYFYIDKILERIKKKIIKKPFIIPKAHSINNPENREMLNVKLHGSCLIFSPLYLKLYKGLYPKTFMYSEEAVLYFIAQRDGLTTIYYPEVTIYHKEDSSTNMLLNRNYKKRRFYLKNCIRSNKVLLELMKNSNITK